MKTTPQAERYATAIKQTTSGDKNLSDTYPAVGG
jgi:hypothetical protein